MSIDEFANARINNLRAGMASPYFNGIVRALEFSYCSAIRALPAEAVPTIYGRFLLICDKAMRSAALLIAGREPEDSVATTRRAIEAARTALAIKLNDANAVNWVASKDRLERWAARQSNQKPKFFTVKLEDIKGDPLIDELDKFLGILSDAYVHFTPEFYSSMAWEIRPNADGPGGQILLNYFHKDDREIERHYTMLGAVHGVILNAFDRCLDGRLTADERFKTDFARFWAIGKELNTDYQRKYPPEEAPEQPPPAPSAG